MRDDLQEFVEIGNRYSSQKDEIIHAQSTKEDVDIALCGKRYKHYFTPSSKHVAQKIRCHKCDECWQRKGDKDRHTVLCNIDRNKSDNPNLKLYYKSDVPENKAGALQKRIKRHGAQYHKSHNENGTHNFFIQSETNSDFGELIELQSILSENVGLSDVYNLDVHDFAKAVEVAQKQKKRQSGQLFTRPEKPDDGQEKVKFRVATIQAVNPRDNGRLDKIMGSTRPYTFANDFDELQKNNYNLIATANNSASAAGIETKVVMEFRAAKLSDIDEHNDYVACNRFWKFGETGKCPDKKHKDSDDDSSYDAYMDMYEQSEAEF